LKLFLKEKELASTKEHKPIAIKLPNDNNSISTDINSTTAKAKKRKSSSSSTSSSSVSSNESSTLKIPKLILKLPKHKDECISIKTDEEINNNSQYHLENENSNINNLETSKLDLDV
jgi:hypothetical protein